MSAPQTPAANPASTESARVDTRSFAGARGAVAAVQPTQIRRPWRATFRTAFQTAITVIPILGFLVPEVVKIILEESGDALPDNLRVILLSLSGGVVVLASIVARIMALPGVESLLRKFKLTRGLAAAPDPGRDRQL